MKIRPNPQKSDIKTTPIGKSEILFSFRFFEKHKGFNIDNQNAKYFNKFLERLKNICTMKDVEFYSNRSHSLRAHPIDWNETIEKKGFRFLNMIKYEEYYDECYYFEISANKHGRVIGFRGFNIFYIVWLDPDHLLYPKKKK